VEFGRGFGGVAIDGGVAAVAAMGHDSRLRWMLVEVLDEAGESGALLIVMPALLRFGYRA
jgi:hypothetical protein